MYSVQLTEYTLYNRLQETCCTILGELSERRFGEPMSPRERDVPGATPILSNLNPTLTMPQGGTGVHLHLTFLFSV